MEDKECRGKSCEEKRCCKGDWKGKCMKKCIEKFKGECEKKDKCCKKLKKDIMVAIAVFGTDLNPIQQVVMCHFLKKVMKQGCKGKEGKWKKECRGRSLEKCKDKKCEKEEKCGKDKKCCPDEFIKCFVKKFLVKEKEATLQKLEVVMDSFKKFMGVSQPPPGIMPPPHHGKLPKKLGKLLFKMHMKHLEKKECMEAFAEKFWGKLMKCKAKKLEKKAKELAKKIVFFHCCEECEEGAKKGIVWALTKTMSAYCMAKFKTMMAPHGEEKKEEGKDACPCGPTCKCGPECQCRRLPPQFGPAGMHKDMKKMFKRCIAMKAIKIGVGFLNESKEIAKVCCELAKKVIAEKCKDAGSCCPEKCKQKVMGKLIGACIGMSAGEKKPDEFYIDFMQRCVRSYPCFCHKKCLKSCCKLAKYGVLFSGVKCKRTRKLAAGWAGSMCCNANNKEGCPKEVCAEYINKWIKDYMPAVEAAMKSVEELKEEMKKDATFPTEKMKVKMTMKFLKLYLVLYCADGKFNKEDFIAKLKGVKETNMKYLEKFMKDDKCCGCKGEDKK